MIVASTLDAVTVYQRGAVCTRKAKLPVPTGAPIRVSGLPLSLQPGSLRARVVAAAGAAPRVLDVRPGYEVELAAEADVPTEQKAVEVASAQISRLQLEASRVEREIAELKKLQPRFPESKRGEPPRAAPVEALLKAAEFVSSQLAAHFESLRALVQQLEDARNELELRKRRLAEASAKVRTERARLSRVAVVTLSHEAEGVELEVEYFVPGARWVPSYALRLDAGMAKGSLSMRAAVAQDTGEDWAGVKLALSTAALDRRTAVPELKSLRIGRAQPAPSRPGWRDPPPGLDELFAGFDAEWARRPRSAPQSAPVAAAPPPSFGPPPPPPGRPMSRSERAADAPSNAPVSAGPPPMQANTKTMAMPAPARQELARARRSAPTARLSAAAPKRGGFMPSFGGGGGDEAYDGAAPEASIDEDLALLDEQAPGAAPAMPPPEPEVELGAELLDYGSLFMPAARAGRGRLIAGADSSVTYLTAMQVEVHVVTSMVSMVHQRAL
ncbi:MAG: mucoidy inhibitor MuiA family protein, partial [Myxococcaceae bacterium]|nr:mucoidy inhibitor MuiA family protein [Myxococcaceae bacterium]